jgi:hypothetical protein
MNDENIEIKFKTISQNRAQHRVHWTLGSLRNLQAFSSLRVFPAPRQSPRPPTCQ